MILLQNNILKRIQEKEMERDSFESEIAGVDITVIDERERNVVISPSCFNFRKCHFIFWCKLVLLPTHAAN